MIYMCPTPAQPPRFSIHLSSACCWGWTLVEPQPWILRTSGLLTWLAKLALLKKNALISCFQIRAGFETISCGITNYLGMCGIHSWGGLAAPARLTARFSCSEVAVWLGTIAAMDPTQRRKLNTVLYRMNILGAPKATFLLSFWKQHGPIQYHTTNPRMVSLTSFPWMRCWWHAPSCWRWTVVYQLLRRPADIVWTTADQVLAEFLIQNHLSFKSSPMTLWLYCEFPCPLFKVPCMVITPGHQTITWWSS